MKANYFTQEMARAVLGVHAPGHEFAPPFELRKRARLTGRFDKNGEYRSPRIGDAANPATYFADNMSTLTGNLGGAVQTLPRVNLVTGKIRVFFSRLVLASQTYAAANAIGVARIPLGCSLSSITLNTDTSLSTSTLSFGDAGSGDAAIYGAAATLTATNTPTAVNIPVATWGVSIDSGFDCVSGLATGYATGGNGGANYQDIIATIGTANLPASGNLVFRVEYVID